MKFKTFMPVLALACVCAVGQADAAQDRLMMPEQPAEPLSRSGLVFMYLLDAVLFIRIIACLKC